MSFLDFIHDVPHREVEIFKKIKNSGLPLMLFGAGAVAVFTLQNLKKHGIRAECFCDNNREKQGRMIYGIPVYSYTEFREKYQDGYNIIISTANMKALYEWLIGQGEKKERIHYMADFRDPWSAKTDYAFIKENESEFEEAFYSLADELSKKVYVNVLNCKLSGDTDLIQAIRSYDQYFDPEAIKLSANEEFLDIGAYTGDTIDEFIRHTDGRYGRIVAMEPDSVNFEKLRNYVSKKGLKSVQVLKKGAWHESAKLSFADEMTGSSGVSEYDLSAGNMISIEVDSVDNILKGGRVTFIKMDIEGSERRAIEGAKETITRWQPKIAASIYHRREDMYDILLLLKSYVPGYRFYVRNYSDTNADTVLYAVK